jgi:hypothetical protein
MENRLTPKTVAHPHNPYPRERGDLGQRFENWKLARALR